MTPGRVVTIEWPGQAALPRLSRVIHQRLDGAFAWRARPQSEGQVFYVTEGQVVFEAGEQVHQAAPGAVLFFLPGRTYRIRAADRSGFAIYHGHFHIDRRRCRTVTGSLREWAHLVSRLDATAASRARTVHLPEFFQVPDRAAVEAAFTRLVRAQREAAPGCDLAAGANFLLLLQNVSCQLLASLTRPEADLTLSRPRLRVARALDFIEKELAQPLGLHEVARHLGVNPAYLARIFRRETGISVGQYVLRRKMAAASERLVRTNLSIKEVAASLGYASPLYFSRRFRETAGMAPSEYALRMSQ